MFIPAFSVSFCLESGLDTPGRCLPEILFFIYNQLCAKEQFGEKREKFSTFKS